MGKRSAGCKYPVARIKKIIQADEEVGKVAATTPVAVCKALEMFIEHVLTASSQQAIAAGSRKITPYHFKRTVNENDTYDFLRDIVAKVPDPVASNEEKPKRRRNPAATTEEGGSSAEPPSAAAAAAAAASAPAAAATVGTTEVPESKATVPARRPRRAASKPVPFEVDQEEDSPPPRKRGRQAQKGSPQAKKEATQQPAAAPPAPQPEAPDPSSAPSAPPTLDDEEDYDADE